MNTFTDAETSEYYDSYSDVYAVIWSHQMHTGYFDTEKSLEQACEDMNVFLATQAGIQQGMRILNVGCGRGGTDRFLAKQFSTAVIGLDISARQLEEAEASAKSEGLDKQISYVHGSMTDLPVPDQTVDCVWVQEALFHCHEKGRAIKECYRVLKPGGVVVLEDTVLLDPAANDEVMKAFGERVHINEIATPAEYEQMFTAAGFRVEKNINLTDHLLKTYTAIAEHIQTNREAIKKRIDPKYWPSLDNNTDREKTRQLVREKKLGCVALIFRKKT